MAVSANRLELLQIADAVAREKSIDKSIVIASMEDALQKAGVGAGSRVLVIGAGGGVGSFAVELFGADQAQRLVAIVGADSDPRCRDERHDAGQTEEQQQTDEYGESRQKRVAGDATREE